MLGSIRLGGARPRGYVEPVHVLLHHPARIEDRRDRLDRPPHDADPARRQTVEAAVVVERHDLVLEEPVERLGVTRVLDVDVR
jgi:hypothetical protein